MKKSIIYLVSAIIVFSFLACERDDDKTVIKDTVPPSLSLLSDPEFTLLMENADSTFQNFNWRAADFGFDASVDYEILVDVKDSSFSNPVTVVTVNNATTSSISVGDFNKILLDKGLEPDVPVVLQFMVASSVSPHYNKIYSNRVDATVTPYATDFPPIYMVGGATGGWDWNHDVEMRSSAPSLYSTVAYFINNDIFRFFKQRNWEPTSYNYEYFAGGFVTDSMEMNANDNDKNFKVLSPSGYYKITVDLKNKIVDFDAVPEPLMFMTGEAVGGWDWTTNYVQMTWVKHGVFEAETEFINGKAFRFFAQKDWSPTSYNYPYFAEGDVDALFENAADGDSNFKFIGTTGMYKVVVNLLDLTVTMEAVTGK